MNASRRKPLVAGNWKMHGNRSEAARRQRFDHACAAVARRVSSVALRSLADVSNQLTEPITPARRTSARRSPAHYRRSAAAMLADIGCRYVIVGHSERRRLYGESDELWRGKFVAGRQACVTRICVGESFHGGETMRRARDLRQLDAVPRWPGSRVRRRVVAYEPVWAIGTGRTATPAQAQEVHALVRGRIGEKDATISASLRVLYGGSVKAGNAAELFTMPDVDGGLIGGASLKADEFGSICAAADR